MARVIDDNDPDMLGRVQVQYDDGVISNWLQVASPFAGPGYGMFSLQISNAERAAEPPSPIPAPRVTPSAPPAEPDGPDPSAPPDEPDNPAPSAPPDESDSPEPSAPASPPTIALVAFAMEDRTYGYVIGFVFRWDENAVALVDKEKKQRNVWIVKTKNGKTITLDDSEDAPSITIEDEKKNLIKIDTKQNEISIISQGNVSIKAAEKLTLEAENVEIKGTQSIKLEANEIDLNAQAE
jgi:uncharacterized protein involved in type VI secretion and phage assembly